MNPLFTFLLLIVCATASSAQDTGYSRVKIRLKEPHHTVQALSDLGIAVDHGNYKPGEYFVADFSDRELKKVKDAGFKTETIIEDVVSYYQQQNKSLPSGYYRQTGYDTTVPPHFSLGSYGGYFTYDEMLAIFRQMHTLYPQLITEVQQVDTFRSLEGRPIYWLKITNSITAPGAAKPQALYTALHHAREPGSLSQLIFYMWYLLDNYNKNEKVKAIVDNTELYFMPCVNPDGYCYNIQTAPNTGGMWRKNRRQDDRYGMHGVDLNRNYGYEWATSDGSSPDRSDETFRGTAAFSEPETRAVQRFTNNHQFLIALNHHTYSNVLIYPWGNSNTSAQSPEQAVYLPIARLLTKYNGYQYGVSNEVLHYKINGGADDWMYGGQFADRRIFAFTPEMGTDFYTPIDKIIPDCIHTLTMNINAAALLLPFALVETTDTPVRKERSGQLHYEVSFPGFATNGTFTVSVEPLDEWMDPTNTRKVYAGYKRGQYLTDSIPYTLLPGIKSGTQVRYLLKVDNGYYTDVDTVAFYYKEIPLTVVVYPNPARDKVTIKIVPAFFYDFPISGCLYNAAGQRIRTIVPADTITELDVSDLSESVYFLKLDDSRYQLPVTKIQTGH